MWSLGTLNIHRKTSLCFAHISDPQFIILKVVIMTAAGKVTRFRRFKLCPRSWPKHSPGQSFPHANFVQKPFSLQTLVIYSDIRPSSRVSLLSFTSHWASQHCNHCNQSCAICMLRSLVFSLSCSHSALIFSTEHKPQNISPWTCSCFI